MRNMLVIICISFLLTGCKAIIASSSPDYFYKNNAYIRSTSDVRKARISAQMVCKRANDNYSFAKHGYPSDLISYPEAYHKEGNTIVFACKNININQSLSIKLKLEENAKNGDERAKEELEDYNRMFPFDPSSTTCLTSGNEKAFSVSCF